MRVGPRIRTSLQPTKPNNNIDSTPLSAQESVWDLGINVQCDLKFSSAACPSCLTLSGYRSIWLDILELRRLLFDVTMGYKIMFGIIDIDCHGLVEPHNEQSVRGYPYQVGDTLRKSPERYYIFLPNRTTAPWNSLSVDIINFCFARCARL